MDGGVVVVRCYAGEDIRLRGVHWQLDMCADNGCLDCCISMKAYAIENR